MDSFTEVSKLQVKFMEDDTPRMGLLGDLNVRLSGNEHTCNLLERTNIPSTKTQTE